MSFIRSLLKKSIVVNIHHLIRTDLEIDGHHMEDELMHFSMTSIRLKFCIQ